MKRTAPALLGLAILWVAACSDVRYKVVVNHEEQYSILLEDQEVPRRSREVGVSGTRETCQRHIDEVWTDMRPLSVRREATEDSRYKVVINHEEQYSILFEDQEVPRRSKEVGVSGTREVCQAHIDEVWTDMRPLSVRRKLGER